MKKLIILFFTITLCTLACKDNKETAKVSAPKLVSPQKTTAPIRPNENQKIVHHFVCPKRCKGSGGGEKGNCPVCRTAYVHNEEYHSLPGAEPDEYQEEKEAPAQNAFGTWHFTCSTQGCEGGAGKEGPCPTCGETLVHNQLYHR